MIKNVILSTLTIAVLAGCSGKKDAEKDAKTVEVIPVKIQKLEKTEHCPYSRLYSESASRRTGLLRTRCGRTNFKNLC